MFLTTYTRHQQHFRCQPTKMCSRQFFQVQRHSRSIHQSRLDVDGLSIDVHLVKLFSLLVPSMWDFALFSPKSIKTSIGLTQNQSRLDKIMTSLNKFEPMAQCQCVHFLQIISQIWAKTYSLLRNTTKVLKTVLGLPTSTPKSLSFSLSLLHAVSHPESRARLFLEMSSMRLH